MASLIELSLLSASSNLHLFKEEAASIKVLKCRLDYAVLISSDSFIICD
jgi:hypothetical protein